MQRTKYSFIVLLAMMAVAFLCLSGCGGANSSSGVTVSGASAAALALSSASVTFSSQALNTTSAVQVVTLTNSGNASLAVSSIVASGDFAQTNNCGASVAASASCTVSVTFTPKASGARTGALTITDSASGSPQSVGLSGTGVLAGALAASPASVSFGSVSVGASSSLPVVISNTGGQAVTVSAVGASGAGFSLSGVSTPLNLAAGQSVSATVSFTPTAAGSASGTVYLNNDSAVPQFSVSLSGTATAAPSHSVVVQWAASDSSGVIGYYAYKSAASGGPYTRVSSSLDSATSFSDSDVVAGATYYYVVTSVNSSMLESCYSNETKAVVPTP